MSGSLVLVATPIGNLEDLAPRAIQALADADLVCCEDTRRTGRLLVHAGITGARLRRVDAHTEAEAAEEIADLVEQGSTIALVTDAGTPGVSDPGEVVVRAVARRGQPVTVVPGPSAMIAALVSSGLSTDRFVFEGFLARRGTARSERIAELAAEQRTVVLYESPRRIATTLVDLAAACGGSRRAVVARELTKLHEEIVRGTLDELVEWAKEPTRGEIVVVLDGAPDAGEVDDDTVRASVRAAIDAGASRRDAVAEVASALGVGRRRVYALALADSDDGG